MKTRFLMVRHATCAHIEDTLLGRALDEPLDVHGQRQACALAERLRSESPLRVECSPRRRAVQTARPIADNACCGIRITPALDELDFGDWAGHTFAELEHDRAWRHWNRLRDRARTPAGVGIRAVQRGIDAYLSSLAHACAGATLVLVTHAEIIRSLVLHCLRAPARDYHNIAIEPASITHVCIDGHAARVESINEPVLP